MCDYLSAANRRGGPGRILYDAGPRQEHMNDIVSGNIVLKKFLRSANRLVKTFDSCIYRICFLLVSILNISKRYDNMSNLKFLIQKEDLFKNEGLFLYLWGGFNLSL